MLLKNYLDGKLFKIDALIKDELVIWKFKIWQTNKGKV